MKVIFFIFTLTSITFSNDPIVAEFSGTKIKKSEVESLYKQRLLYPSHKPITMDSVLNDLVNKKVSIMKAKQQKLDQDPYVKERFDDILHNALISKDLEDKLSKIKITDSEIKNYYATHKEYKSSHILYRLRAVPSKKEVETGLRTIASISKELKKAPAKFEELAVKHSQVATNKKGGDIGFLPHTSMSPEYFQAINGKQLGFITEPIRTQFGFHIVKLTGVRKFTEIDKGIYKKIIFDQKRDKVIADYYASLKKNAKVKVYKNRL